MASSAGRKAVRALVVLVGVFVILAVGLYGPATLVGPLPPAAAEVADPSGEASVTAAPTVPTSGASAIVAGSDSPVLAAGGLTEAVPIGGTAKAITALVVLDAKPMDAGAQGETIPVTRDDYDSYVRYLAERARAVPFITGETWTQREMLQAMLLGSSNNHADSLARWAFGSMDAYLAAASTWLAANGLTSISLVDATGLDEGDVGTATDLARVSALAYANPAIAEIMSFTEARVTGNRGFDNLAAYAAAEGYRGLSRSYTDQAGVCFLFALDVTVSGAAEGTAPVTLYGAFLREPDWETLDAGLTALASSASTTLTQTPVVTEGQAFVTYTTAWGETAHGVAMATENRMLWVTSPLQYSVDAKQLSTGAKGEQIGSVTVTTPDGDINVLLELDQRLGDPGPMWRLTNPVPVITAFIDSKPLG